MEYVVAAALTDGEVSLSSFGDEAVARPAVRDVLDRVQITEDGPPSAAPIGGSSVITVNLRSGDSITSDRAEVPRGDPQNPLSWLQLADKFRDCAKPVLSGDRMEQAISLIETMDDLQNVRELTDTLMAEG